MVHHGQDRPGQADYIDGEAQNGEAEQKGRRQAQSARPRAQGLGQSVGENGDEHQVVDAQHDLQPGQGGQRRPGAGVARQTDQPVHGRGPPSTGGSQLRLRSVARRAASNSHTMPTVCDGVPCFGCDAENRVLSPARLRGTGSKRPAKPECNPSASKPLSRCEDLFAVGPRTHRAGLIWRTNSSRRTWARDMRRPCSIWPWKPRRSPPSRPT